MAIARVAYHGKMFQIRKYILLRFYEVKFILYVKSSTYTTYTLVGRYTFSHCESAPSQLNAAWGNSFRQLHSNYIALRQILLE